ncbi:hypothetical protein LR48_Vigan02g223600 [Vigna angularis]|uniref:Uncharacterized protein n=2 Tax=Phaseolus angularis TaxID=3914 RepID=A0A0L9U006_PHAAN|nr:hypothetical protein LR48_Vigan02g223600 [Vigna angularis]BAT94091.1 hypothetical protein VIGAN_08066100 [Vigna angularis var. angularis]
MGNKYVAVLLVVWLVAAGGVDAQIDRMSQCVNSCLDYQCKENPTMFCTFVCRFGCASTGIQNVNLAKAHAEAPQFPRKVQAPLKKDDYAGEMQGFH